LENDDRAIDEKIHHNTANAYCFADLEMICLLAEKEVNQYVGNTRKAWWMPGGRWK
jgi:hypothetical protein